jgi:antirestriction protein ArdC
MMNTNVAEADSARLARFGQQVEAARSDWVGFLNFVGHFHHYSYANLMMIYSQCPQATHVASYKKWQALGRQVRRGEQGLAIFVPKFRPATTSDETDQLYFRTGYVFDVSQTEGDALPTAPTLNDADGDDAVAERGFGRLQIWLAERGWRVIIAPLEGHRGGRCHIGLKLIEINQELGQMLRFGHLVHEAAHAMLHGPDDGADGSQRELEAESVAAVVCEKFGVPRPRSATYVAVFSRDTEALMRSTQRILAVVKMLVAVLEPDAATQEKTQQPDDAVA